MVRLILIAPLLLCASLVAESLIADIKNVPLERLTANLTRMVKEKPQDLDLRVNLARVYAMAYAHKVNTIPVATHESEWIPWFVPNGIDVEYQQFEVKTQGRAHRPRVVSESGRRATAGDHRASACGTGVMDERIVVRGHLRGWRDA